MLYVKITNAYIKQVFDTDKNKFISQSFELSDYDRAKWEHLDGIPMEGNFWDEKEFGHDGPYLPYPYFPERFFFINEPFSGLSELDYINR